MAETQGHVAFTDEHGLVAGAKRGDGAAFTQLVDRYERKIFRLAKHITQNEEDAEDVVQDTFLKAYEHVSGFREQSKFYTWLVRIAVNQALTTLRRRKPGVVFSLEAAVDTGDETVTRDIAVWDDNPEQQYSREELRGILQQAVDDLSPIFRTVLKLRDVNEISAEETARALGISVPAIKSRLLRARLKVRDKMTQFFKRRAEDVFTYV